MVLPRPRTDLVAGQSYPAKDLVRDLLAANRGPLSVAVLLTTAQLFDFTEGSIRVALSRLAASGMVHRTERDGTWFYDFTSQAEQTNTRIREHVDGERRLPWSGTWMLVSIACPVHAKDQRQAFVRELERWHFHSLNRGLWLRPDNLPLDLGGALEDFRQVGSADVFVGAPTPESGVEERVTELWAIDELAAAMTSAFEELEESRQRVPHVPHEHALVETFRLGTHAFRLVARDPLLPLELLPKSWPGEKLRRMLVDYNHLSCDIWSEAQGVRPDRNPGPRRP